MTAGMGVERRTEARDEIATFGTAITDGPAEGVFGRLRALALVDLPDALDALDRVEALHQQVTIADTSDPKGENFFPACDRCREEWPCADVRAIRGDAS